MTPRGHLWLAVGGPGTPGALLVSRDGGRRFVETTLQNPRDPDAHHFYAVYALDEDHVWACGAAGEDDTGVVWRTADGGRFWEVLMAGDRARGLSPGAMYTQVLFTDPSRGYLVCAGDTMLATRDGGRHWAPYPVCGAHPFGVYFLDDCRGWLVSHTLDDHGQAVRTRLYDTEDAGVTWAARDDDLAGLAAVDVAACCFDADGWGALCGPDGLLLTLAPGSTRWRFARGAVAVDLNFIARSPDGSVWVAGADGTLLVSRDGGRTYQPVPTGTRAELHAIAFMPDPVTGGVLGLALGARGVVLRFDPEAPASLARCPSPWP